MSQGFTGRAQIGGAYVEVQDQRAAGVSGGTFTSGARVTRVLNTVVQDPFGLCTLMANQIKLAAGTYRCWISAAAHAVNGHRLWLRNVTAGVDLVRGQSAIAGSGSGTTTYAEASGEFTVAADQSLEVQHRCETTIATIGLGYGAGWDVEVYLTALFEKVR